jgi:hypothetical protein
MSSRPAAGVGPAKIRNPENLVEKYVHLRVNSRDFGRLA